MSLRKRVVEQNPLTSNAVDDSPENNNLNECKYEKKPQKVTGTNGEQLKQPTNRLSLPLTFCMVTLLIFGLIGTLRMRKHAVERGKISGHRSAIPPQNTKIFTPEELSVYDGKKSKHVYIALLGSVFDVTSGRRIYGPGGSYHFFAGRDASKAFMTGKFKEDLNDDIRDFTPEYMSGLVEWLSFYQNHATYTYVGKVIGQFYDANGRALPLLGICKMSAAEFDEKKKEQENSNTKYCAFKWHKDTGGIVSCDEGSYPRRVMSKEKNADQKVKERCTCMPTIDSNTTVLLYDGCPSQNATCFTKKKGQS